LSVTLGYVTIECAGAVAAGIADAFEYPLPAPLVAQEASATLLIASAATRPPRARRRRT
jgi:hypothetical protein